VRLLLVPALLLMFWGAKKASSVQALAAAMGADPDKLQRTVQAANEAAAGKLPDPLGKSASMRQALDKAPFYALDISIGSPRFPLATLTLGGLRVNEDTGHVRHAQGHDVPGLFAAGRCAIGLPSSRYVSGLSLADCVFSGRRAGRAAAQENT
jgi:3-oxo-5alpha-steroid 4-dehydrogenase